MSDSEIEAIAPGKGIGHRRAAQRGLALHGLASPAGIMLLATGLCVAGVAFALALAVSQPWLGLALAPDAPHEALRIEAVTPESPAARAGIQPGQRLVALASTSEAAGMALRPGDLIEEPDAHETYVEYRAFMARQSKFAALLAGREVALLLAEPTETRIVQPGGRPLGALPLVFWVQVASALAGLVIGAWVWSLRRGDLGAGLFALSGLGLFVSALCAGVYSTRELALDGAVFTLLSAANHLGAYLFGGAMIALFLTYPRRLVPAPALLLLPAILGPWYWASVTHRLEELASGIHLPTTAEMLAILLLVVVQRILARHDPVTRAALRWMGLSVVLGAGAFVAAIAVPQLLGHEPAISQGYAFAFFVLVYAGIALGIRRYRLFELGSWSFRILFYTAGALLLVALDAGLVMVLQLDRAPALKLRFPFNGRGLFGPPQLRLVRQLAMLVAQAAESRDAYERGVAEERQRIARDLHDDVGARLMTGLHGVDAITRPILQAALTDIRAIVNGLTGEHATLERVLAEMRHEAARRLEAASITLDWPLVAVTAEAPVLDYHRAKALTSAMREIVSNAIRHARASRFEVQSRLQDGALMLRAADDGVGFATSDVPQGFGLGSMRRRVEELGGSIEIDSDAQGTRTVIRLALLPVASPAA